MSRLTMTPPSHAATSSPPKPGTERHDEAGDDLDDADDVHRVGRVAGDDVVERGGEVGLRRGDRQVEPAQTAERAQRAGAGRDRGIVAPAVGVPHRVAGAKPSARESTTSPTVMIPSIGASSG